MAIKVVNIRHGTLTKVAGFGYTPVKMLGGSFVFSESYQKGGEPCPIAQYFGNLMGVVFEPRGGYLFFYDHDTGRVVAHNTFVRHNHIHEIEVIRDEVVTVTEGKCSLEHKAAHVLSIEAIEGDSTGAKCLIGKADILAPQLVSVDYFPEEGNTLLTFSPEDKVLGAKVTYVKTSGATSQAESLPGTEVLPGTDLSVLGAVRWLAWGT